MTHRHRSIEVGALARVEGEGALDVRVVDGRVVHADLRIYEPPRFFEAFLRGRAITEAPDITARICGICPVAYQMSACQAAEAIAGVEVDGGLRDLRRLLYCGEWIESHALHIYLLHAPDFLGVESAIELAATDRATVERGLRLKKVGNHIIELVGGRAIHPVNVQVGGFHRAPTPAELAPLGEQLRWARDAAVDTVRWVAGFDAPDLETDATFVALTHPSEYAVLSGRIATTLGHEIPVADFDDLATEEQVAHSTALHARLRDGDGPDRYLVGPLARYALNADRLSPLARETAADVGLEHPVRNPFRSVVVRAVEVVHACDTALALLDRYEPPPLPSVEVPPRAGVGCGATEAPRGLCGIATPPTPTGPSPAPGSCRPRRRTSARSSTSWLRSSRPASPSTGTRSPTAASTRSATTTPASPAPPTSSTCGSTPSRSLERDQRRSAPAFPVSPRPSPGVRRRRVVRW
jgi:coenzyme F420-reducing hydrogenase alpha subunit